MLIPHLFNYIVIILIFYTRIRPRLSLSGFPTKIVVCGISHRRNSCYLPRPSYLFTLLLGDGRKLWSLLLCIVVIIVRDCRFRSTYFPQHFVVRYSRPVFFFSFQVEEQVPRVYQVTDEINLCPFKLASGTQNLVNCMIPRFFQELIFSEIVLFVFLICWFFFLLL